MEGVVHPHTLVIVVIVSQAIPERHAHARRSRVQTRHVNHVVTTHGIRRQSGQACQTGQRDIVANVLARARTVNVLMHQPVTMAASMATTESGAVIGVWNVTTNARIVRTLSAHNVYLDITHQVQEHALNALKIVLIEIAVRLMAHAYTDVKEGFGTKLALDHAFLTAKNAIEIAEYAMHVRTESLCSTARKTALIAAILMAFQRYVTSITALVNQAAPVKHFMAKGVN